MNEAQIVNTVISSGLLAAVLGLVLSAAKYAKTWVDAKTTEVTAKIKNATVKHAVSTAEDCATTVAYKMSQTVVDDLKAASADGKLTAEEAAQVKANALAEVKTILSEDVINTVHTEFGDADAWLTSKIEAAVKQLHIAAPTQAATLLPDTSPVVDTVEYDTTKAAQAGTADAAKGVVEDVAANNADAVSVQ